MKTTTAFVTCKSSVEARKIARALLRKRLVACANIITGVHSAYWWKGKIEKSKEALLMLKTRKNLAQKVAAEIGRLHSYQLPVIEFFETSMNRKAEKWVEKETIRTKK
ncbi:MAG: divalent-cation tolerance protein CutA [Candidatus Diapherotrites archaeon]|nr:divalent-cation tolerance protein CutA [Candidatus Diapherotrites archaeon]